MRYQRLGNSGLKVSELCLGTMTFGEEWGWGAPPEECRRMLDAYLDAGGNFVDTANLYTNGTSETLLGEFLKGRRQQVVLATKYTNHAPGMQGPNAGGNSRKSMMEAVEASLRRLKTDYIDLYWLHIWDFITPVEEVMRAFDDLVRQGKVLYVGMSDTPAWVVSRAQTMAELRGWSPLVALQVEYSLLERTVERELIPMADTLGLTVTPWAPLAAGLLSGKYRNGKPAESRLTEEKLQQLQSSSAVVEEVSAIAEEVGRSAAQVALAWLRQRPVPTIPIIGARKASQIEDNLQAVTLTLSAEQLQRLDEVSAIEMGFPHSFFSRPAVRNYVYAGYHDRINAQLP
jgi:aryl-alcohol dehydrogenase-like predicted oxidoreductase